MVHFNYINNIGSLGCSFRSSWHDFNLAFAHGDTVQIKSCDCVFLVFECDEAERILVFPSMHTNTLNFADSRFEEFFNIYVCVLLWSVFNANTSGFLFFPNGYVGVGVFLSNSFHANFGACIVNGNTTLSELTDSTGSTILLLKLN